MNAARGLILALAVACNPVVAAPPAEEAAWRLAILAERLGKLQAQASQGIAADRARRAATETSREFESRLRAASASAPGPEVRDLYVMTALLWQDWRAWVARPASRDNVRAGIDRADELAWILGRIVRLVSGETASLEADAARAALLAQRIPRLLLSRRASPADARLATECRAAVDELQRLMDRLVERAAGDAALAAELDVASNQARVLARAVEEADAQPHATRPYDVAARSGDHVMEAMQRAARRLAAPSASPRG